MNKRVLTFLLFLLTITNSYGSSLLDRIITVEIKNTPIKTILGHIENRAEVKFSYNPSVIDIEKRVSLSIKEKTVAYGLSLIFNHTVRFKAVANHIVLLKNENETELKERKKSHNTVTFKGQVIDASTGKPLPHASIYDVEAKLASSSNSNGFYELTISNPERNRSLYFSKKGYHKKIIVLDATSKNEIIKNIRLERKENVEKIAPLSIEPIYRPIEERAISGGLVSQETYRHTENLKEIKETRIAQISFVPAISFGSNLSTNGLITNNLSLNILAGYSNGTAGVEIGGILNMVNGNAKWVQLAGMSNLVGGSYEGIQVGGILNSVRGSLKGVQVGGIANMVGGDFIGVQIGGITNLTHKDFAGVQVSGISSISRGDVYGIQVSGIFSGAKCGFTGIQLSGIGSMSDSLTNGLQLSGIYNTSLGRFNGVQIAGISNHSVKGNSFLQLAGIGNITRKNVGLQLGGIFNYARVNNGLQVGLLNFSSENNGLSLGLFNYVHNGYHKIEVYNTESFHLNLGVKTGTKRFYNTYHLGVLFEKQRLYSGGLGFGTHFDLSENWSSSVDLIGLLVFKNDPTTFEFNNLYKLDFTVEYGPKEWITFFAGPSVNLSVMQFLSDEGDYPQYLNVTEFLQAEEYWGSYQGWIGWKIGIRI